MNHKLYYEEHIRPYRSLRGLPEAGPHVLLDASAVMEDITGSGNVRDADVK